MLILKPLHKNKCFASDIPWSVHLRSRFPPRQGLAGLRAPLFLPVTLIPGTQSSDVARVTCTRTRDARVALESSRGDRRMRQCVSQFTPLGFNVGL